MSRGDHEPEQNGTGADSQALVDREIVEALTRTTAHLAAQLTMSQIRLRALATVLERDGTASGADVQAVINEIAQRDLGLYLRENLGDALVEMIEVDDLSRQLEAFLQMPE